MGTDIHIYVEERIDGEWQPTEKPYVRGKGERWERPSWVPDKYWEMDDPPPNPEARSYGTFAFLADVRNGYGFAGVFTHKPVEPQVPGRGIPEDTSLDRDSEHSWLGDHSFTHAMLDELLDLPWDTEFYSGGVVGQEQFRIWQEEGIPNQWSGGISGPGITVHDNPEEYARMLEAGEVEQGKDFCCVRWTWQPLLKCQFYLWIQALAEEHDPENTRIVMGFDS